MMKHLSERSTAIFRKLTEGLKKVGDHQQWNNNSSFLAACVEVIGRTGLGPLVSVAHYYEQNHDMMRDPDVVFVIGADQEVYPISFRQDSLGTYLESAVVENGKWKVRTKMQADIVIFCNDTWFPNLNEQQQLGVK